MVDVDEIMAVSGNGTTHEDVVNEQISNYEGDDDSSEIVARIPNYFSEIKEGNGEPDESFVEEVEESNDLDAFKELQMKDTDLSAQPRCQNTPDESFGPKNDMKDKPNGNGAKKSSSVKSGSFASDVRSKQSVVVEKKSRNAKPATNQVKAHLSKQPGKSNSLSSTANVVQSKGTKEKSKVKQTKTVHASTTEGQTHSSESSTAGDEKPQRLGTLPAYSFNFKCNERAEKRKEFYSKLEEKIHAQEEEKSSLQAKNKENQEAEIRMLRKRLTFKATPMPNFYHEAPPKTELKKIPTTRAKSPKLGRKKDSPTTDTESNGGNTFLPPRLSLEEKKSLNNKPSVPTKKHMRKSLPKLPSEKTKLPSTSKDKKNAAPSEITVSSNEANQPETQQNKDSPQAQVADSPIEPIKEKAELLAN